MEKSAQTVQIADAGPHIGRALNALLHRARRPPALPLQAAITEGSYALTLEERLEIVDQALFLFREVYVNRPLKEAVHAVQPVRRLELLRLEIERQQRLAGPGPSPRVFHREMTEIFMSVRDRHMRYLLPRNFRDRWAVLGFDVEQYFDDPPARGGQPRYMVTRVLHARQADRALGEFVPGVEVVSWNGVPIERAIELNGDRHAGSNPAAHHARGLTRLTVRPLWVSPAPDEQWVIVGYRPRGTAGPVRFLRFSWWVAALDTPSKRFEAIRLGPAQPDQRPTESPVEDIHLGPSSPRASRPSKRSGRVVEALRIGSPTADLKPLGRLLGRDFLRDQVLIVENVRAGAPQPQTSAAFEESLDDEADAIGRLRKDLLRAPRPSLAEGEKDVTSRLPGILQARIMPADPDQEHSETVGYLRLYSFVVEPSTFVAEVTRLLRIFQEIHGVAGLILDLRDNGGGHVPSGERLLQLFTPLPVEPERFELLATPTALKLSDLPELRRWRSSLEQGAQTGALYSRGFPITRPRASDVQVFDRPVVLIVNALSYSTTDIFAAGFQDHGIGKILATDDNLGAGGANTVRHADLLAVSGGKIAGLRPLPRGVGMKTALRRSLRVGEQSGMPLEGLGLEPDARHYMTAADLLDGNRDLRRAARQLLRTIPSLDVRAQRHGAGAAAHVSRFSGLAHEPRYDLQFVGKTPIRIENSGEAHRVLAAPTSVRIDGFSASGHRVTSRSAFLESQIDLRADPFLDLYFFVRFLAESQRVEEGYEDAVRALDAARELGVEAIDLRVLETFSPAGLSDADIRLDPLAKTLDALERHHRNTRWPLHRRAIAWQMRRLRTVLAPREHDILTGATQSLGLVDPVIEIAIYLITHAPPPGAFHYRPGARSRSVCLLDLQHNPGDRLVESLVCESLQILATPEDQPADAPADSVFSKLASLMSEHGLEARQNALVHSLLRVHAGETLSQRLNPNHRQSEGYQSYERLVRPIWTRHLGGELSVDDALQAILDEIRRFPV